MISIMIVDDEYFVREGLINCIEWEKHGFEIVGCAENGKEALEKIQKIKPDILLTDIKMPIMDGIELIKEIRKRQLDIKIVILSCYEDFEYAKNAIKYNVEEYVLKLSTKPEEIIQVLNEIKNKEINRHNQNHNKHIIEIYDISVLQEYCIELPTYAIFFSIFDNLKGFIEKILQEDNMFSNTISTAFCYKKGLLVLVPETNMEGIELLCKTICNKSKKSIYAGISLCANSKDKLGLAIDQAILASKHSFYEADRGFFYYNNLNYKQIKFVLDEKKIINDFQNFDEKSMMEHIDKLFILIENVKPTDYINYCIELIYILVIFMRKNDIPVPDNLMDLDKLFERFNHYSYIENVNNAVLNIVRDLMVQLIENSNSLNYAVIKVKSIVEKRFNMELKLEDIAHEVNMSYSYLSNLFKKETGETFKEYVNYVRIEEAKELLKKAADSIYIIAEKVGYTNAFYFNKVFKKITGMTPGEYRDKNVT